MVAEPVRMLGIFGGPVGAGYAETKAQQIEQAGGARQGYDPMAIGEQTMVPIAVGVAGKLVRSLRTPRPPSGGPPVPPQIAPVPQPKPVVKGSYFGPERRTSALSPAQAAEEQIARRSGRFMERRKTIGEGANPDLADYHRYYRGEPGAAEFLENFDRTRRGPP